MTASAGRIEEHRLGIGFKRAGNCGELGGARPPLELCLAQRLDECPQPIGVIVDASACLARNLLQPHGLSLPCSANNCFGATLASTTRQRDMSNRGACSQFATLSDGKAVIQISMTHSRRWPDPNV